jgi:hypothetical protein
MTQEQKDLLQNWREEISCEVCSYKHHCTACNRSISLIENLMLAVREDQKHKNCLEFLKVRFLQSDEAATFDGRAADKRIEGVCEDILGKNWKDNLV